MGPSPQMGRVFISHSHRDNELVRDIARRLSDAGLKPIVDFADLPIGKGWRQKVREQMDESDAMLILVTPSALKSDWMMAELGMAEGLERTVLPVTVGLKPRDLPEPLRTYRATPFDEVDHAIKKLAGGLIPDAQG